MKISVIAVLLGMSALSACATAGDPQPMPGSLTYNNKTVHSRARPGTVVKNSYLDQFGYRVVERYVVQPDGTLKLTWQHTGPDYLIE